MLQKESKVRIVDNTWAKIGLIFQTLKWNSNQVSVGDVVVIAVKSALPSGSVKKWDVVRGVIVRTRKEIRRKDWSYIRFEDNAVVLVDTQWELLWKRIFWPVALELRDAWWRNVTNMAEEVI